MPPQAQLLPGLLIGVSRFDLVTWTTVLSMFVAIIAIAASYVQGRGAAAVDPLLLIRRA